MSFPQGTDYNVAVQNPRTSFSDPHLKECLPETTLLGLPKPYSGGFTTTYRLMNQKLGYDWAVRCFTRDIPDLEVRYRSLERFFDNHRYESYFVKTWHLQKGIRTGGDTWYPTIKMQWIEGVSLDAFVRSKLSAPKAIEKLSVEFADLIWRLEQIGFAHGDLQHGNILVKDGKLFLIDYDGSYVPEIASLGTNNLGHVNYQHPGRSEALFDAQVDRFSAIVIYLGLVAVAAQPSLWRDFDNGENILFRRDDFLDTDKSALFARLSSLSKVSALADRFKQICRFDPQDVPSLDAFLKGNYAMPKLRVGTPWYGRRSQYPVIDCNRRELLLQHVGKRVEAIGFVSGSHENAEYQFPYHFLNLGQHPYPHHAMTLILWTDGLKSFEDVGKDPSKLKHKWVSVTGVISVYNVNGRLVPQIIVDNQAQIQELSDGEIEARARLAAYALNPETSPTPLSSATRTAANLPHDVRDGHHDVAAAAVFNKLYGGGTSQSTATSANTPGLGLNATNDSQHQAAGSTSATGARWYTAYVIGHSATPTTQSRIIGSNTTHASSPTASAAPSRLTSLISLWAYLSGSRSLRMFKQWLVDFVDFIRQRL